MHLQLGLLAVLVGLVAGAAPQGQGTDCEKRMSALCPDCRPPRERSLLWQQLSAPGTCMLFNHSQNSRKFMGHVPCSLVRMSHVLLTVYTGAPKRLGLIKYLQSLVHSWGQLPGCEDREGITVALQ